MSYALLLNQLLNESTLTAKEISEKCKEQGVEITPSYISLLRNQEKNRIPSNEISQALAQALNKHKDYLVLEGYLDSAPELLNSTIEETYKTIMTMGVITAKLPFNSVDIDTIVDQTNKSEMIMTIYEGLKSIPSYADLSDLLGGANASNIAFEVADNSLTPIINKGDKVTITGEEHYDNGDLVVIALDGNFIKVTCRKYQKINDEIFLLPYSNEYQTLAYDPSRMKILGKITSVTKSL